MPASNSDKTMTIERTEEVSISRSTGSRLTIAKATAVPPNITPRKLQKPENNTAGVGRSVFGIDNGRDRVRGIVKTVNELKAEGDQEREDKTDLMSQRKGVNASHMEVLTTKQKEERCLLENAGCQETLSVGIAL